MKTKTALALGKLNINVQKSTLPPKHKSIFPQSETFNYHVETSNTWVH